MVSSALVRTQTSSGCLKPAGAWLCLLLLGWALAGSWLGHNAAQPCDGGVCHLHAEDVGGVALSETNVEERDVCLACHLLRCLQTATASAVSTAPVLPAQQALATETILIAAGPTWANGSARAPPLI
jgi:hypothetical protein